MLLFSWLRSHAYTPVISLNTLDDSSLLDRNIILIGTEFCASKYKTAIVLSKESVTIGKGFDYNLYG